MNKFLLIIVCLIIHSQTYSQPPPWIRGNMPQQTNSSYYFKITQGEGNTLIEARYNAILVLIGELSRNQGVAIKGKDVIENVAQKNKNDYREETTQRSIYQIETEGFKTRFEIADEYYEKNMCWVLFEVAYIPEEVSFDKIEFTTDYKGAALWRSLLVPGWGQMHKRNLGKGITILSLQVVTIAGICICNNLSDNYYNKAMSTRNNSVREAYQDKSSTYRNIRNGCVVATGAIYVYNIIDALAGKGAKKYKKIQFNPYIDTYSQGLSINIQL